MVRLDKPAAFMGFTVLVVLRHAHKFPGSGNFESFGNRLGGFVFWHKNYLTLPVTTFTGASIDTRTLPSI